MVTQPILRRDVAPGRDGEIARTDSASLLP